MHLDEISVGSVVRLHSGSIKFTVERIQLPSCGPGQKVTADPLIHLVGWSDRGGIHRFSIHHACLCKPRAPEAPPAPDAST